MKNGKILITLTMVLAWVSPLGVIAAVTCFYEPELGQNICFGEPDPPPPASDTLPFPTLTNDTYYTKIGDINNDGRKDIFVTGNNSRIVGDFILRQITNQRFVVMPNPSQSQKNIAQQWPQSSVTAFRRDENRDGVPDFLFRDFQEDIPGGEDIIVLANTNNPAQVRIKTVKLDDEFYRTVDEIEMVMRNPGIYINALQQETCTPTFTFQPLFNNLTAQIDYFYDCEFEPDINILFEPVITNTCSSSSAGLSAQTELWAEAAIDAGYLPQLAMGCPTCLNTPIMAGLNNLTAAASPELAATIGGATRWGTAARAAGVIIIADDATGIGVADDVLLIPIGILIGIDLVYAAIQNSAANETESTPIPNVGTDRFALQNQCMPNDPNVDQLPGSGSSDRLRRNLDRSGCGCGEDYENSEAHHIVPTNDGNIRFDGIGNDLRDILEDCGIDLDDANNGVCLPTSEYADETSAQVHRGGSGLHTRSHYESLLSILEAGNDDDGCSGVKDALRFVREELMNGRVPK